MYLDTTIYERLDTCIQKAIQYIQSGNCKIASERAIQEKLTQLSSYCRYRAQSFQQMEQQLIQRQAVLQLTCFAQSTTRYIIKPGMGRVHRVGAIGTGIGGSHRFSVLQACISQSLSIISVSFRTDVLQFSVQGEAHATLLDKDGNIDPQIVAYAGVSAAIAKASFCVDSQLPFIKASAQVNGSFGVAYGEVKAVFSKEEQVLRFKAGAAAVTGEAQCAFEVLGVKVTLSASASLGCAEAELTYEHKNREWEFGSKLGFIAGLGFRVKVEY